MTTSPAPLARPSLTVVTGRPGSGKSSLAPLLARSLRCPVISRDEIKEGLVNTVAQRELSEAETTRQATEAFFETVELLLRRRVTLVVEAAFQHRVWAPRLEPLRDLAHVRVVLCTLEAEQALSRRIERALADTVRERFHPEPTAESGGGLRSIAPGEYDPPRLDVPTLQVDTSDGYQPPLEVIVSFARGQEDEPSSWMS